MQFRHKLEPADDYHANLTRFRGEIFDLLREGMENKFAIVDFASALVDGAAFVNAMANRERDETSVERKVRLLIAQTQVELERLQAEASGDLFDMEIVN